MVKNTTGGKGSKNIARKFEQTSSNLRLSSDPDEIYAIVVKSLGNSMFHVNTIHGLTNLLLRVRGKFSGKNKRNNFISVGSFVLIGLRDFENPPKQCDLLEIYSDSDVKRLMNVPSISNSQFFLQTIDSANHSNSIHESNEISFSNDDYSDEIYSKKNVIVNVNDDVDINIDEI
jgi:translation initiation factor IF-1